MASNEDRPAQIVVTASEILAATSALLLTVIWGLLGNGSTQTNSCLEIWLIRVSSVCFMLAALLGLSTILYIVRELLRSSGNGGRSVADRDIVRIPFAIGFVAFIIGVVLLGIQVWAQT